MQIKNSTETNIKNKNSLILNKNIKINKVSQRNNLLSDFAAATLKDRYLLPDEDFQDMFIRVSSAFADSEEHAQRLYDYMSQFWFMPATPILSNGGIKQKTGKERGMPISCFLNECQDSLDSIIELFSENSILAAKGGGIGSYFGNVRSIGENVGVHGTTSGVIPFLKIIDSITLGISQGGLRRGSAAVYLPIHHPEIHEFCEIRKASGGDLNRRCLNLNHGVLITDKFMQAVEEDGDFELISPKDGSVREVINARELWSKLLIARMETGEPYIIFIDTVNNARPLHHKKLGLNIKMSNLCSEITLNTGIDHLGGDRTAVCCLSSLNLEHFETWSKNPLFIEDIMRFLDNVLQYFIDNAPDEMKRAKYSAYRERSVGLGVMGFHSFLQSKNIPFSSLLATSWNNRIFEHIDKYTAKASKDLAIEKGSCPDAIDAGMIMRFSNTTAIAPTASISIIAGCSPSIEPIFSNIFTHKTLSGSFAVKNPYLDALIKSKNVNYNSIWQDIASNEGSIQNISIFTDDEKEVFKTAFEIDQMQLIKLAGNRSKYITQAQSLNIFLPHDVTKTHLNMIHYQAWKRGVKSLYYLRSTAARRPDNISSNTHKKLISQQSESFDLNNISNNNVNTYQECESCQ
ncbi:MAG: ribonucleoside-diphosphate reductase subunit alpha [Rickettsiales bacterium]